MKCQWVERKHSSFPFSLCLSHCQPISSVFWPLASSSLWHDVRQSTGLVGDGSLHSVPPCWDKTWHSPPRAQADICRRLYAASSKLCVPVVILWQHPSFRASRPGVWGSYWLPGESFYHLAWKGGSWIYNLKVAVQGSWRRWIMMGKQLLSIILARCFKLFGIFFTVFSFFLSFFRVMIKTF